MASVNRVILLGRLGRDPEFRQFQSGPICRFSIATSRRRKDSEETEWHNITCFGKTADLAQKYLKKGSEVYIEGRIHYGQYTAKDGTEKKTTDILCESLQFGSRPDNRVGSEPRQQGMDGYSTRPPASGNDGDVPF